MGGLIWILCVIGLYISIGHGLPERTLKYEGSFHDEARTLYNGESKPAYDTPANTVDIIEYKTYDRKRYDFKCSRRDTITNQVTDVTCHPRFTN